MKLRPFSTEAKCPKCGHTEIAARWEHIRNEMREIYGTWQRMIRTCGRCGYHWDEACLDVRTD